MAGKGAVFMGKYFGTDGFRGEANVDLTSEHAYQIGKFIGWYYGARKGRKARVVIGKDTRRSSYMFEYAIVGGPDGDRRGCLYAPRHYDAERCLCHPRGQL